jgi:hypothetical protein
LTTHSRQRSSWPPSARTGQISQWKAFFLQNASSVFSGPKDGKKEIGRLEKERDELHKVIGEKEMDIDFLKKNLQKLGLL